MSRPAISKEAWAVGLESPFQPKVDTAGDDDRLSSSNQSATFVIPHRAAPRAEMYSEYPIIDSVQLYRIRLPR